MVGSTEGTELKQRSGSPIQLSRKTEVRCIGPGRILGGQRRVGLANMIGCRRAGPFLETGCSSRVVPNRRRGNLLGPGLVFGIERKI